MKNRYPFPILNKPQKSDTFKRQKFRYRKSIHFDVYEKIFRKYKKKIDIFFKNIFLTVAEKNKKSGKNPGTCVLNPAYNLTVDVLLEILYITKR